MKWITKLLPAAVLLVALFTPLLQAKQMGIGPRWGITNVNGRVLVGGIMYDKYLGADPTDRLNFLKTNWLANRMTGIIIYDDDTTANISDHLSWQY